MRKSFTVEFDGFWIEASMERLPKGPGVYVVYASEMQREDGKETVSLQKTVYIGSAIDVRAAIKDNPLWDKWKEAARLPIDIDEPDDLDEPSQLAFAYAYVPDEEDAQRIAHAIVFEQHTEGNDPADFDLFPYDDTMLALEGKTGLLNKAYEIYSE